jgi:hypothetical protein
VQVAALGWPEYGEAPGASPGVFPLAGVVQRFRSHTCSRVPVVAISPLMHWWNNVRIGFGWLAGRVVVFLYGLFLLTCGGAIVVVSVLGLGDSVVLGLCGVVFGVFSGLIGVLVLHQALARDR